MKSAMIFSRKGSLNALCCKIEEDDMIWKMEKQSLVQDNIDLVSMFIDVQHVILFKTQNWIKDSRLERELGMRSLFFFSII